MIGIRESQVSEVIVFATNAHKIMEARKCGNARERKKYIARNRSDSAIGVPHTSRMAAVELLSAVCAHHGVPRFTGDRQKIRPVAGHFGFIASLTLHRSWKRREGFCRIFIRFECTHEDHSNGFIILIPAGFLGGRVRTRMISAARHVLKCISQTPG